MTKLITPVVGESASMRQLAFYRNNYEAFSASCLKIRDKNSKLVPFVLSPVQRLIHSEAEAQKAKTGMVRAICLKYRRAGASSYILGRGYGRATLHHGVSVAIMAHVSQSTAALYRIVKRFQEHNPIAPPLGTSNIRGLEFEGMDSRYGVFSAETEESGRGEELGFLHLSEAAYAPNLEALMSGIGNCVSDVPGTEVWLESTAKEPFGDFYERTMDCVKGASEYKLIFVPWNNDPTLTRDPPEDFEPSGDREHEAFMSEKELMQYHGLTLGQICWRRRKMNGPRNIVNFSREFPLTVEDCFSATGTNSFISAVDVVRARKANIHPHGAIVMGVDPASQGGDRFTIAVRQGRKILSIEHRTKVRFNEGLEWVRACIQDFDPDMVFIDAGGGGNGDAISSALRDTPKYRDIVRGVNFGSTSQAKLRRPDKPGPKNRKAEMLGRVRDALESEEGLDIPDDTELAADLCAPQVRWINQEGDWDLVPKAKLKVRSHDLADAIGLTYADEYVKPLRSRVTDGKQEPDEAGIRPQKVPPPHIGWMG